MRISDWSSDVCSSGLAGPVHARGRELLARLLARLGRSERAIQILRDGLASVPGQPAWVELLARVLDGTGQRQQAIDLLASQGAADNSNQQALLGALATPAGRRSEERRVGKAG